MKKNIILVFAALLLIASCGEKKESKKQLLRPPAIALSAQDTIQIMEKVKAYDALFKANRMSEAAEMLYFVRNDSIFPLTQEKKEAFVKGISTFHIYDTKIDYLIVRDELNNEVCIISQIIEDGNIRERKGITKFFFNPVKKDGMWYLTVRDKYAEGVNNPYAR